MLYGISELPEIIDEENGKPAFRDENLPHFSISYAGNIVGVALSTEGDCGLDMELPHASRSLHASPDADRYGQRKHKAARRCQSGQEKRRRTQQHAY